MNRKDWKENNGGIAKRTNNTLAIGFDDSPNIETLHHGKNLVNLAHDTVCNTGQLLHLTPNLN